MNLKTLINTRLSYRSKDFHSIDEYYNHLYGRAISCKQKWRDMGGIDPNFSNIPDMPIRESYYEARISLSKRLRGFNSFQYIGVFRDKKHFDRIERLILESKEAPSEIRCLQNIDSSKRIEVTIVDNYEVILGYFAEEQGHTTYMAIEDSSFVSLISRYYDDLWVSAKNSTLKSGIKIYDELLLEISTQLSSD